MMKKLLIILMISLYQFISICLYIAFEYNANELFLVLLHILLLAVIYVVCFFYFEEKYPIQKSKEKDIISDIGFVFRNMVLSNIILDMFMYISNRPNIYNIYLSLIYVCPLTLYTLIVAIFYPLKRTKML
ncbi:MAG: hypothetical protein EOP34_02010 [Rickettsiales bacterium]|nr:MAG: hypothetical protein EOP34_02010 [Rickettsiales bacterium]